LPQQKGKQSRNSISCTIECVCPREPAKTDCGFPDFSLTFPSFSGEWSPCLNSPSLRRRLSFPSSSHNPVGRCIGGNCREIISSRVNAAVCISNRFSLPISIITAAFHTGLQRHEAQPSSALNELVISTTIGGGLTTTVLRQSYDAENSAATTVN